MNTPIVSALTEHLTTAILVLNGQLQPVYLNPAAESLLEASASHLCDQPLETALVLEDSTREVLLKCMETGQTFTQRECTLTLASGATIHVDFSVSRLQDALNTHLIMEFTARDRLDRISREEALLAKQEATRLLVRGLAHEIKNPLGGIRGAAQLLQRVLPDDDSRAYTRIIIEESDRLRHLVDRMLGPTRLPERVPLNIHEVLERVIQLIQAEAAGRITLVRDYDPSLPEIPGDRSQLVQVFLNLARNAMQALLEAPELPERRIIFRTRPQRQFTIGQARHRLVLKVSVVDTGPGIDPRMQESLFYPMVSGRAEGTGLGLSIAQSIVGQHGGLIECESRPGHTEFMVYLPLEAHA
ncbi:nitrogen regulation protein NR(II) [Hahella sp. SMD15-11]|uniref:Sensory histidine kinase/phosphatase NtrB n=1 Tax=Thermohahella caldifontis TaxID=3142973 RepID=A0AB39UV04_9GAMM